jgi:two-component system, LytTR family, sensor kinase
MLQGSHLRNPVLINSIGHTAGLLLFGLVVFLLLRDLRAQGLRRIKLSLAAAILAFTWNAGSLLALGFPNQHSSVIAAVTTVSFSALSLLPAVLLHVALQGRDRWPVVTGYAVSASAILLHIGELFSPDLVLHQSALFVIALGFGLLAIVSLVLLRTGRSDPSVGMSEWISLICLLLFSTSFLHFSPQHVSAPWASEVTWHHIGIPVALIVLLQDYRFLLLDTFARFLVNFGLASLYIMSLLLVNQRFRLWEAIQRSTFRAGIYLVLLCVSLILFAYVRNILQAWMGRVIFRRQSTDACGKVIANLATKVRSEEELLSRACQETARHLDAERFAIVSELIESKRIERPSVLFPEGRAGEFGREDFSVEAQIPLRFSSGDFRVLIFGPRRGGRRYLSEDLEDMRRLGSGIVEQVERFRAEELKRLAAQAELRALQAQINPHFLFNALNALYGTIDRGSYIARRTVLNLAEIFRYVLQGDRAVIQLSEELKIVQAYLEIEALRLGDRLETELVIADSARSAMIPILSIQPLIENAVKHGISGKSGGGRVSLKAERNLGGLLVTVEDTGIGFEESSRNQQGGTSMGIENVRRRLLLCHGPEADLHIQSSSSGTKISFFLPDASRTDHTEARSATARI